MLVLWCTWPGRRVPKYRQCFITFSSEKKTFSWKSRPDNCQIGEHRMLSTDPTHKRTRTVDWQNAAEARQHAQGWTGLQMMQGIRDGTLPPPPIANSSASGAPWPSPALSPWKSRPPSNSKTPPT
jgi:hypothetical protein